MFEFFKQLASGNINIFNRFGVVSYANAVLDKFIFYGVSYLKDSTIAQEVYTMGVLQINNCQTNKLTSYGMTELNQATIKTVFSSGKSQFSQLNTDSFQGNGKIFIKQSVINKYFSVQGLFTSQATLFDCDMQVESTLLKLDNCTTKNITVKNNSPEAAIIELIDTTVNGNFIYSGNSIATLYLKGQSHVTGTISGVNIIHEAGLNNVNNRI